MDAAIPDPLSIDWTIDLKQDPNTVAKTIEEKINAWIERNPDADVDVSSDSGDDTKLEPTSVAPILPAPIKSMYACMKPFRPLIWILKQLAVGSDAGTYHTFRLGLKVLEIWKQRAPGFDYVTRRYLITRGSRHRTAPGPRGRDRNARDALVNLMLETGVQLWQMREQKAYTDPHARMITTILVHARHVLGVEDEYESPPVSKLQAFLIDAAKVDALRAFQSIPRLQTRGLPNELLDRIGDDIVDYPQSVKGQFEDILSGHDLMQKYSDQVDEGT